MNRRIAALLLLTCSLMVSAQQIQHVRNIQPHERRTTWNKLKRFVFGGADIELQPHAIVPVSHDRYVVTDTRIPAVVLMDRDGSVEKLVRTVGDVPFGMPVGACADGEGGLYVVDSVRRGLVHFDGMLDRYRIVVSDDGGRFTGVTAVHDRLYVVDTDRHCVRVYDPDGHFLSVFGERGTGPGQFNYPTAVTHGTERIYVLDTMNFRIQVFDRDGQFLFMFGRNGNGGGEFGKPKAIAVDNEERIFVSDVEFDHVQAFDRDGNFLYVLGSSGQADGRFWMPSGLCFGNNHELVVADTYNHRIQEFRVTEVEK